MLTQETARRIDGLSTTGFAALWDELAPEDRPFVLKSRCRTDRALFLTTFFDARFEEGWSAVHRHLLDRSKTQWSQRIERGLYALAAPRAAAKSTIMSFGDRVHDVCYGFEKFVVLISTTFGLSQDLVKDLYGVFTDGEAYSDLHAVYGPFRVTGTQTDFVVRCPRSPSGGTRIMAGSFGGTVRGVKHDGCRPTLIVIDDGEHPERVRSPEQRAKTWDFLTKDILKAGRRGTHVEVAGTVLHGDSMLARLLVAPGWAAHKFRAMESWPVHMKRWEECRGIWAKLENPRRVEDAYAFYLTHRTEMDEGARFIWTMDAPTLWDLMVLLWSDGIASFYSEKQNEPRDPERTVFNVDAFRRCTFDGIAIHAHGGRRVPLSDCELATWLDPSLGKETSDFPALATVARERKTGYRFVLLCTLDKGPPSEQRRRVWSRFEMFARGKWGTDETGLGALFGEGFEREREERKRGGVVWNLPMRGYNLDSDKLVRIARLEPDASNGWVQFANDLPPAVLEQFRDFPTGANDDGPDAIERADWLLGDALPTVSFGA
jgi:predicted phage terminase large subunit-like protein